MNNPAMRRAPSCAGPMPIRSERFIARKAEQDKLKFDPDTLVRLDTPQPALAAAVAPEPPASATNATTAQPEQTASSPAPSLVATEANQVADPQPSSVASSPDAAAVATAPPVPSESPIPWEQPRTVSADATVQNDESSTPGKDKEDPPAIEAALVSADHDEQLQAAQQMTPGHHHHDQHQPGLFEQGY